jgi:hypothetical protein
MSPLKYESKTIPVYCDETSQKVGVEVELRVDESSGHEIPFKLTCPHQTDCPYFPLGDDYCLLLQSMYKEYVSKLGPVKT